MTTARPRTPMPAVALLLALVTVLSACSASTQPTTDPTKTLAAAKRQLDATSGVHVALSTKKLPTGVSGLVGADGIGTHAPAFSGTIKVSASGVTADASVVAVNGKVYAKLPFTTKFAPINPADFSAPDPARLMSPTGGLSSLLTAAKRITQGGQVRQGKTVLRSFTGTVPGRAVAALIPSASRSASFHATFTVTDKDRLARAVLTGPFYPAAKGTDVTYTVTFGQYGFKKTITAP